ncbi:Serine/threonine-protein phosphatase 4 regulatory subunit 2 [Trichoplax sp. H2]|nr:Serine/threonine-protein phosphatase 4 regulatory subunit 2 [Trichoplax sp. H2]|eukprot:RDD43819.1 Serine/threonine-protein phosphatase 4 regulatory subunit 2 [Trichoplax sp. H2]
MDNLEEVLEALHSFSKNTPITEPLEKFLQAIAKTGDTCFPWSIIKPLIVKKLDNVMCDLYQQCKSSNSMSLEAFNEIRARLLDYLDSFIEAPFTMQRIAELLIEPYRYYSNSEKFLRGIEKNILVISTVEPNYNNKLLINHKIERESLANGIKQNDKTTKYDIEINDQSVDNGNIIVNDSAQHSESDIKNESMDDLKPLNPGDSDYTSPPIHKNGDDVNVSEKCTEDEVKDKSDHNSEPDDDATPPISPSVDAEEELNFGQVVIPKVAQNALQTLMTTSEREVVNSNHTIDDGRLFLANEDSVHCK